MQLNICTHLKDWIRQINHQLTRMRSDINYAAINLQCQQIASPVTVCFLLIRNGWSAFWREAHICSVVAAHVSKQDSPYCFFGRSKLATTRRSAKQQTRARCAAPRGRYNKRYFCSCADHVFLSLVSTPRVRFGNNFPFQRERCNCDDMLKVACWLQ